ncbi:hypothetical protein JAO76_01700 [Pontibacter sp. BT310]|uniref:Inhibitor I9 domain-containing protein n=1 Tax=Pontibacter populi TaxID=890055 RepID=A0ABS6X8B0_9BACT|nr:MULTISPECIES: hypothetical protein [Pontibacter]MBJ6116885.1 hypothetical protein [Pontibacter sp. BT310]MBR0569309.1 hypothetical protein [Microvirga sp. STS03]MBW3363738.1 hypothetical protein [Pontibacter populi]
MKYILLGITLILALISGNVVVQISPTQIVETNNTVSKKPLFVLRTNGVDYKLPEMALKEINPDWINEVQVIKELEGVENLTEEMKDGIVILTFKENVEAADRYLKSVIHQNEKVTIPVPEAIRIKE